MNSLHDNQGGESVKIALDGSQVALPAQHHARVSLTFTPIRVGLCFFCYKLFLLFLPLPCLTPPEITDLTGWPLLTCFPGHSHLPVFGPWQPNRWMAEGWGAQGDPCTAALWPHPHFLGPERLSCVRHRSAPRLSGWVNESEGAQQRVIPFLLPSPLLPFSRVFWQLVSWDTERWHCPSGARSAHAYSTLFCWGSVGVGEAWRKSHADPSLHLCYLTQSILWLPPSPPQLSSLQLLPPCTHTPEQGHRPRLVAWMHQPVSPSPIAGAAP